jgi:hypothetical protein
MCLQTMQKDDLRKKNKAFIRVMSLQGLLPVIGPPGVAGEGGFPTAPPAQGWGSQTGRVTPTLLRVQLPAHGFWSVSEASDPNPEAELGKASQC